MTLLHLWPEMHITRTSWTSHYTQISVIPTWLYIWQNCLLLTDGITGLRGNLDHEDSYLGPLAWFMRSDSGDRTLLNIVSTAHYLSRRGKKKDNRKHDLNQERIHGWPKYYKKNRKNKWQRQINRYPTGLSTGQYWAYATGLERKEDGKPCVISVTMILSEKLFRRSSPYFKQVFFCKRPENITPSKDYHKTRK